MQTEREPITKNPSQIPGFDSKWPSEGAIEFKNFYAKYRPSLPFVIVDLSCKINGGEKIGIVGRTGSGKSTLFQALLRIIETDLGEIEIDGVNIAKLGLDDLRRKITIIPQNPMLFSGTLRDNLDFFNKYSDEELYEVLKKVQLFGKVQELDGLDTIVIIIKT